MKEEAILALPRMVVHDACEEKREWSDEEEPQEEKRPNPFVALAALKKYLQRIRITIGPSASKCGGPFLLCAQQRTCVYAVKVRCPPEQGEGLATRQVGEGNDLDGGSDNKAPA